MPADKVFIAYLREAVKLNEVGMKEPHPAKRKPLPVPAGNAKARATFENFSPSCQREYVEWITEVKREKTRDRRIATTLEWLAEGKQKNWKYK